VQINTNLIEMRQSAVSVVRLRQTQNVYDAITEVAVSHSVPC